MANRVCYLSESGEDVLIEACNVRGLLQRIRLRDGFIVWSKRIVTSPPNPHFGPRHNSDPTVCKLEGEKQLGLYWVNDGNWDGTWEEGVRNQEYGSLRLDFETGETTGPISKCGGCPVRDIGRDTMMEFMFREKKAGGTGARTLEMTPRLVSRRDDTTTNFVSVALAKGSVTECLMGPLYGNDLLAGVEGAVVGTPNHWSFVNIGRPTQVPFIVGKDCSGIGVGVIDWEAMEWFPIFSAFRVKRGNISAVTAHHLVGGFLVPSAETADSTAAER